MKSVQMMGNRQVRVVEAPKPKPGPGEVLVRLAASAICGSEMKLYYQPEPAPFPAGHEMMGYVAEAPRDSKLKEGDRVGIYVLKGCGICAHCKTDHVAYCPHVGVVIGGHSEYVAAPEWNCVPIPDDVPDEPAVLLVGDGIGVGCRGADRIAAQPHEWVLVTGVGPVGLGAVTLLSGLSVRVIAMDVNGYRLDLARQVGAEAVLNPKETDVVAEVRRLTGGRGCHGALECSGKPEALSIALDAVRPAGRVAICGECHSAEIKPSAQFIHKELSVFGCWYFRISDTQRMFELYRRGMPVEKLITHRFPLEQAQEAHDVFAAGKTGKVLLVR